MTEQRPIGIIGAMNVEVEALLAAAEIESVEARTSMRFHRGTLEGVPVVIAQCGAGKVNAALCAQVMIDAYAPRLVLNVGVAGGLGPVKIGELVVATGCIQHDYDITAAGTHAPGELPLPGEEGRYLVEFPCDPDLADTLAQAAGAFYDGVYRGTVVTGDQFVASSEKSAALHAAYGALACEMEGGAIAHACLLNTVPCAVLRSISDNANDDATVDFPSFARESAHRVQCLLTRVLLQLARA